MDVVESRETQPMALVHLLGLRGQEEVVSTVAFGVLGTPRKYQCLGLEPPVVKIPQVLATGLLSTVTPSRDCDCSGCRSPQPTSD